MKKFLQEKSKIIFLCLFIVMTCTACSNPRGTDGKTKVDEIIASEQIEVKKSLVNVTEIEDKKLSNEYKKLNELFYNFNGMTGVSNKWKENGNCQFIEYMNVYKNLKVNVEVLPFATVKKLEQNTLKKGDILCTLYTNNEKKLKDAKEKVISSIKFSNKEPEKIPLIFARVEKNSVQKF